MALAGEEDFPRDGRLQFLDNQLDSGTGTIRVRALFANADGADAGIIRPPASERRQAVSAVLVKDQAVGTDLDKRFVYVVGEDQSIAYRPVTLGRSWTGCAWCATVSGPTKS